MDIESLLNEWYDIKKTIAELENRLLKLKNKSEKYMDEKEINKIENSTYTLKRRLQSRTTVQLSKLPKDIKDKYSSTTDFYIYALSKKKK